MTEGPAKHPQESCSRQKALALAQNDGHCQDSWHCLHTGYCPDRMHLKEVVTQRIFSDGARTIHMQPVLGPSRIHAVGHSITLEGAFGHMVEER